MDRRSFLAAMAASGIAAAGGAAAQPVASRPLRLIIPLAPGGATDPYGRLVAEHMGRTLGRPVIVEHKPGGGGIVGSQLVLNAPADGSHMLLSTQAIMEIIPNAHRDTRWSIDDFLPLIRGVTAPLVLAVNPSVPARTLPDLIAWIKQSPGKLSYSSYLAGTPAHFLGFQLNERFGLDLVHVPSRGSGAQQTDLIAGHVLFGFTQMQSSLPFVRDGKLVPLAVTDAQRSRFLPEVPTFVELGLPEFTTRIWFGLFLRAGTPPDIVGPLLAAVEAAHEDAGVRGKLEAQGFDLSGESGTALAADLRTQSARWARLIAASGYKAD
ncbi:MAG: tripartite tricarboxylate transporter substrate binding protein [Hyphomicrobiales bacterium]|nr:tripartite tricarboxylate transporter substrate binding protein [Hyphomicrobiales bacterium]